MGKVDLSIIGKRFGSLIVLNKHEVRGTYKRAYWLCRCDCGNEFYVLRDSLIVRKINYCENCKPKSVRKEKLYTLYYNMLQRCYNNNNKKYNIYGGKGIKVCDKWLESYNNFKSWCYDNGYKENLSIDRIDSYKDYCPENCRWITLSENSIGGNLGKHKNKSKLKEVYAISPDGERVDIKNICEFSRKYNLNRSSVSAVLHGRMSNIYNGWEFYSEKTTT